MKKTLLTLAACTLSFAPAFAGGGRRPPDHHSSSTGTEAARPLPPQLAEFDADGDGVLNTEEKAAARAAHEARHAAFVAGYDTDGDGVLSKDELVAASAAREEARAAERTAEFTALDADGSGGLSSAELAAGLTDLSAERVAALFARFDTDTDSAVSLEEFLAKPAKAGPPPSHGKGQKRGSR